MKELRQEVMCVKVYSAHLILNETLFFFVNEVFIRSLFIQFWAFKLMIIRLSGSMFPYQLHLAHKF